MPYNKKKEEAANKSNCVVKGWGGKIGSTSLRNRGAGGKKREGNLRSRDYTGRLNHCNAREEHDLG